MPNDDVMPLVHELSAVVRRHMAGNRQGKENVLAALNALGIVTAHVLSGTSGPKGETPSAEALIFFNQALSMQCRELSGGDAQTLNS